MTDHLDETKKPLDWPANDREALIETIYKRVTDFIKEPNYKTREFMLACINQHDLNQRSHLGLIRITEYEVGIINDLFYYGHLLNIPSLRTFLYEIVGETTRMQKMTALIKENAGISSSIEIPAYDNFLVLPLKLYHYAYQKYNLENNGNLAQKMIDLLNEMLSHDSSLEMVESLSFAFNGMLNDLSYVRGTKTTEIWKFTRQEIKSLFQMQNKLLKLSGQKPNKRPLKGVLMTQISNYILKSRYNYNSDNICKYVSPEVVNSSFYNHQLWMKRTELLNDEREEKVIPELFNDKSWIPYSWVQKLDFSETRTYYVSSFSKELNNQKMLHEYGSCVIGNKNDRIAELIGPIGFMRVNGGKENNEPAPFIGQVAVFDVLYDKEIAKEELVFLMDIINDFDLTDAEKKCFLEEIMQYWILSVKDPKWSYERERRYVIFLYDDYSYPEIEIDDVFLKVKTSIMLLPDFYIGEDVPVKEYLKQGILSKAKAISVKPYIFCSDCYNRDYDIAEFKDNAVCPVCGSSNIVRMEPRYSH